MGKGRAAAAERAASAVSEWCPPPANSHQEARNRLVATMHSKMELHLTHTPRAKRYAYRGWSGAMAGVGGGARRAAAAGRARPSAVRECPPPTATKKQEKG